MKLSDVSLLVVEPACELCKSRAESHNMLRDGDSVFEHSGMHLVRHRNLHEARLIRPVSGNKR